MPFFVVKTLDWWEKIVLSTKPVSFIQIILNKIHIFWVFIIKGWRCFLYRVIILSIDLLHIAVLMPIPPYCVTVSIQIPPHPSIVTSAEIRNPSRPWLREKNSGGLAMNRATVGIFIGCASGIVGRGEGKVRSTEPRRWSQNRLSSNTS